MVTFGDGTGAGDDVGVGFGLPPEEPGAGGVVVPVGVGAVVDEGAEGPELEAGRGPVIVVLVSDEAAPPHPEIAKKSMADRPALSIARGKKRISRF